MGNGAPGAIPTRDLSLRRRALYATELREHNMGIVNGGSAIVQRDGCNASTPSSTALGRKRYHGSRFALSADKDVSAPIKIDT
jgi:hypothetical protein